MRFHHLFCLPLVIAAFAAVPGAAQPASQAIVVTGTINRNAQVQRFVKALAIPSHSDQIGRFERAVCPATVGLSDRLNSDINNRIRRVAVAAGIRVANAPCTPNILLFFTSDRKAMLAEWGKTRPSMFGTLSSVEIDALARSAEPAVAWQVLEVRGSDGRTLNIGQSASSSILSAVTTSRLTTLTRIEFVAAFVVIDVEAIKNLTKTQIADYAAVRALAHIDMDAAAKLGMPTILTVLKDKQAGRASPLSMTAWDLAYLKSLYGMTNALQAGAQRGEIERLMLRNLADGSPG